MTEPQVLALGETMIMVTPTTPAPLDQAATFRLDIGGAESNVACHLVTHGVPAAWASAVGDDALGRRLLATLRARGVDTSLVAVDPNAPTGVYFKDPGQDGTTVLYYRRGSAAARLGPDFAATLPLDTVPLVHVSGITAALSGSCRALLDEVIERRRDAKLPVSFDVNYRPSLWDSPRTAGRELLALARRCDLVFVGRDEAETLWGTARAQDVYALIERDLVVKDGAVGAYAYQGGEVSFVPAEKVEVVEPVGAGDAFAGGYLAADLGGQPAEIALACGHRSAAATLISMADI
jgi:2-dehydro-3-deoxygluconokinase